MSRLMPAKCTRNAYTCKCICLAMLTTNAPLIHAHSVDDADSLRRHALHIYLVILAAATLQLVNANNEGNPMAQSATIKQAHYRLSMPSKSLCELLKHALPMINVAMLINITQRQLQVFVFYQHKCSLGYTGNSVVSGMCKDALRGACAKNGFLSCVKVSYLMKNQDYPLGNNKDC